MVPSEEEDEAAEEGGSPGDFVRCLRCGAAFPRRMLGAHLRAHPSHGPVSEDWSDLQIDSEGC